MQTVGLIKAEFDATPEAQRPKAINVDVIGIGAGVVDRLKELGLPVVAVNVAEAESIRVGSDISFNRLRDELWWRGREWLEAKDCKLAIKATAPGVLFSRRRDGQLTFPGQVVFRMACEKELPHRIGRPGTDD